MKRIFLFITAAVMMLSAVGASSQEVKSVDKNGPKKTTVSDPTTELILGDDKMSVASDQDATVVRLGNRIINLTDGEDGPRISIEKINSEEPDDEFTMINQDDNDSRRRSSARHFHPHWSGFEFGLNNYLGANYATTLPAQYNYMDLNTGKSFNVNINFAQLGLGITRHFGLVTGLGLEFNDYVFEGNNNIVKNDMGEIEEYDATIDGLSLDKSKLSTTYFTVPVLLELQIPVERHNTLNLSAGIIAGAKVSSHTKMVYHDDGKQKIKEKNDYSLNMLRYGPTVRIGYESFQIYGTYYMNGLFEDGKGPELYPIQVGVAFTFD